MVRIWLGTGKLPLETIVAVVVTKEQQPSELLEEFYLGFKMAFRNSANPPTFMLGVATLGNLKWGGKMKTSFTKHQLVEAYAKISVAVQSGQLAYNEGKLNMEYFAFRYSSFGIICVGAGVFCLTVDLFVGGEGVSKFMLLGITNFTIAVICKLMGNKYQTLARQFLAGTIPSTQSATSVDELTKLHGLFKSGALTQEEFDTQKRKVLGKSA